VVIKRMGGEPLAEIQPPVVKSTAENLKAAIAGESYERDVMYPQFIEQAERENDKAAQRTFNYALAAEAEHATLYTDALKNLESRKGGTTVYYVCPVCGKTVTMIDFAACPVCACPKDKFAVVQ
jgi:rubrerythrin